MRTITFYSYKGGVGRSLALANIAERLAEFGKKVCLLDFDLEAPGLHYKFLKKNHIKIKRGIVDYIYEFTNKGILQENILDYTVKLPNSNNNLILIPAGDADSKEYWKKLSSIDLYELLYENENGLSFLLDLKEKIRKEINPDFLLIDSRTGVSEISGITLSILADDIVIIAANNNENLDGVKKIISSLKSEETKIFNTIPKMTFVLSRVPFTEKPEDKAKELFLLNRIKTSLLPLGIETINIIHSDRELEENEVLKIGYEKDEKSSSQISRDYLNLFEKITENYLSADEIIRFNQIKESERLLRKANESENSEDKLILINKAIELNNKNIEFLNFRALVYESLKRYDDAINDYRKILDISKDNVYAMYMIAQQYVYKEDYPQAIEQSLKTLKIRKDYIYALFILAYSYSVTNKIEDAIKIYTQLISMDPENGYMYNGRANCYKELEQYEEAYKDIYKSLELNPNLPVAYATLAEIHACQNKINEFYLSLELAFQKELETSNEKNIKELEKMICKEKIYKKFIQEQRFITLLDKYGIEPTIFK